MTSAIPIEQLRAQRSWKAKIGDVVWVLEDCVELCLGRDAKKNNLPLGPYRTLAIVPSANPKDPFLMLSDIDTGKFVGFGASWWLRKDEFLSAVRHAKQTKKEKSHERKNQKRRAVGHN